VVAIVRERLAVSKQEAQMFEGKRLRTWKNIKQNIKISVKREVISSCTEEA
jgi:ABC-type nitrate/sulfonate/bicarbonate transport system ATPase subunit